MVKRWLLVVLLVMGSSAPADLMAEEPARSLPPGELGKYCDPFEKLREDLWERSQYTWTEAQRANFKAAEIAFEDGRLKFQTRAGGFSKAGLASKFYLRGDFDIQVDCAFSFLTRKVGMDQVVLFIVMEKDRPVGKADASAFMLRKRIEETGGALRSGCSTWQRWTWGYSRGLDAFTGTLRFVREGKNIKAYSRNQGSGEWEKLNSCRCTDKDVLVGLALQNFQGDRNAITADARLAATFDNFKINAAQAIVESEI